MKRETFTVESGYVGRDGQARVFVRGRTMPLPADQPLPEGASVIIVNGRAVRASS